MFAPTEEQARHLLAAAAQTSSATFDLIEGASEADPHGIGNIANGDTATILADGLRLLLEATHDRETEDANQLLGALTRFLDSRT